MSLTRNIITSAFVACLLITSSAFAADARIVSKSADGTPTFVRGDLGTIDSAAFVKSEQDRELFEASAGITLKSILAEHFGATGLEEVRFIRSRTERGKVHLRFNQEIHGLPVAGTQLVLHADAQTGRVDTVNGQFIRAEGLPIAPKVDGENALDFAVRQLKAQILGERTAPELTYVLGRSGTPYLAWQSDVEYVDAQGHPQRDTVFADAVTGNLVARHPQIHTGRSLETRDYNETTSNYTVVSTSSNSINTGDAAIDDAHNYAIATYDYFWNNHGRDSFNDNGATIKSRVHYDKNYNNAFWNGASLTYGDGDAPYFYFSRDADVVAHEFTHGMIDYTSDLVYQDESGALNEALADIFGAMVDRQEGASGNDIWYIGEDLMMPIPLFDKALRNMADPKEFGDYHYYPTRYTGNSDNGGVHWNSGIANLAFHLLVEGGTHPRDKTSNVVPGLGFTVAADIFYQANANCLTSSSNFEAARNCTGMTAYNLYGVIALGAVEEAWEAVGVPGGLTLTKTSKGGQDGWVLESNEHSGVGGSKNPNGEGGSAIRVGDDGSDRQYKSILSFDTSAIPSGVTIVSAELSLVKGEVHGTNPFNTSFGDCKIDIKTGGFSGNTDLQKADFEASATATDVARLTSSNKNWASLNSAGLAAINKSGITQLRLYFGQGDNDDKGRDTYGWYSGEHSILGLDIFQPRFKVRWIE